MQKLNKKSCVKVPQRPGIYRLYDRNKKHIYTGRSQRLRHRISSWYQKDKKRPKWKRELAAKAMFFTFTVLNGKRESMKKEKRQVRKQKPKYNHYLKK